MIDIAAETPAALRLAAQFFIDHAALKEALEGGASVPTGTTPAAPAAPFVSAGATAAAVVAPTVAAAAPTAPSAPAAPPPPPPPSNVLPFVPPTPTNAPAAATPGTSAAPSPSTAATASPGASGAPPATDEYDDHGVPYDARIHQKGKSKKKDGSWKLQKGIADAIVTAVMQELAPRIRKPTAPSAPPAPPADAPPAGFGTTPLPVGASAAPVSLPPVPPIPGQAPVAPPPPQETVAPDADPFRALVSKISQARGTNKISAEEVAQCCAQAGAPNVQTLKAMPHLIPVVESFIDSILVTR